MDLHDFKDVACGTGAVLFYLAEHGIIARSGFMHLPDQKTQKAALLNLRDQLIPGGILTLNTFDPWTSASKCNSNLIWILKRKD